MFDSVSLSISAGSLFAVPFFFLYVFYRGSFHCCASLSDSSFFDNSGDSVIAPLFLLLLGMGLLSLV